MDADVRVEVYDAKNRKLFSSDGAVETMLPRGLYRVRVERCGAIESCLVDHEGSTNLHLAGPPFDTPVPISGAAAWQAYYSSAAEHFSRVDTGSALGEPPHASRLFVLVRRADARSAPAQVPSEPLTIHDVDGRLLSTLCSTNSSLGEREGFVAFSARVAPGTYRIRAARSRRDVAITIPAGRAAHIFVADCGTVRLDDLRVALRPVDHGFDPSSRLARAMESVIAALKSPSGTLLSVARSVAPDALNDDLCFGIAVAHLAWRSQELVTFERVMDALSGVIAEVPDLVILDQLRGPHRSPAQFALDAPPLLRASLALAMTRPEFVSKAISADRPIARAARTAFHDSIWCTFSDRPWDERWIEPTLESLRTRSPDVDARTIACRLSLDTQTVEQTIEGLDATMPLIAGARAQLEDVRIPGYELDHVIGRGSQGTVFRARRHGDPRTVALKVVPLLGGSRDGKRVQRELDLMQRFHHPALLRNQAHGVLPDGTALWFETELYRCSLLDLVSEVDAPLALEQACSMVLRALEGLAFLHAMGVVHRDIKPSNLLLGEDDRVVIADFGLAKSLSELGQLTSTGKAAGTVRFAPPEQLVDFKRAPPASDVWSMSATLYFLLTLELPRDEYAGQSELDAALENPIVPLAERCPGMAGPIADCIDRALSSDIDLRPRNGAALRDELSAALHAARYHEAAPEPPRP
ncbi:MAG TPA: serine/threonine-protein kinase [Kofleriaceae bacterium]